MQNGVACTWKQLPVPEPPQVGPSQPQRGSLAADWTQALSHADSQQNGSLAQMRVQQASSEQLGSGLTTQQLGSSSLPQGGTGQASFLPVHVLRAVEAQTLSQSVSQQ